MASEGNTNDSAANAAVEIIRQLLGSRIICTLADGRRAEGKLICVDRLCNIILADCTERRLIKASDYNDDAIQEASNGSSSNVVTKEVTRFLRQAMVPGVHLVKVEMDEMLYQQRTTKINVGNGQ